MPALLIHYHELALKGKNRRFFEDKLQYQIQQFLKSVPESRVKKLPGRLLLQAPQGEAFQWQQTLKTLPGIANTQSVEVYPADLETLPQKICQNLPSVGEQSFAIRARRDSKQYPFTSVDLGREIGQEIQKVRNWSVDLNHPDYEIFVEIVAGQAYVAFDPPVEAYRGLPVGVAGRGLLLLSGGFDSPVAGHLMQCRGLEIYGVHFHSAPLVSRASLDKVKELCEILGRSQAHLRLALVPIVEFQKAVVAECPESLRILLYRRFMMKLAQKLASQWKASCLVTGDSLSQVASQTLKNMTEVSRVVDFPILRPLIGLSKEWILKKSQAIGTHEISILPHEDCCGYLMPRHPATQAQGSRLEEAEASLDLESLMAASMQAIEKRHYECGRYVG